MLKILPYKLGSKSARDIAKALGVKRIIPDGGYKPKRNTMVLNWGTSIPRFNHDRFLNKPVAVSIACNKSRAFNVLKAAGVLVVEFTADKLQAQEWQEDGYRVVVRHKLQGHSGQGIQVCQPNDELPYAPLYTKYTKKDSEYRVHVFQGKVIDWTEKCKRNGLPPSNNLIRTHSNGWVFCRTARAIPPFAIDLAIKAVTALGLDFGGVDIIVRNTQAYVLEVNTAPGVEASSLNAYVRELRKYV